MAPRARSLRESQFDVLVGKGIMSARKAAQLSGKELAARIGISQQRLASYEVGDRRCPLLIVTAICEVLGIDVRRLIPKTTTSCFLKDSSHREKQSC